MEETSINTLEVISCTLNELLNVGTNTLPNSNIIGQLSIPEYQRPYVWKEKQINNLLNDLLAYNEISIPNKPLYYLGSIIIHNDQGTLKIIDGQQRLTTALLLKKIKGETIENPIQYSNSKSIQNIKYNLSYLKSIQNKDVFEFRNADVFNKIDFNNINITLIITDTEDLAYTFFETQNTGGVRLAGSDILKAHHLRAIESAKLVNYQARKWEAIDNKNIEYIIQQLTKIRYWDNRKWRRFPFYRDKKNIKEAIIDEYTLQTNNNTEDISYHYSAIKKQDGQLFQTHESNYKQLKQPLSNGNNTLDYINDYVELHTILFKQDNHYNIDDVFYKFIKIVLHGYNGTLFLKELTEVAILAYISRFGFHRLYEATLWLYRAIYSLRVTSSRNVREDSIFKFVYERQFIDNILEVYTPDELFLYLKKFHYNFNTDNADTHKSKGKHIQTLRNYFNEIKEINHYRQKPKDFDKDLFLAITNKIEYYGR